MKNGNFIEGKVYAVPAASIKTDENHEPNDFIWKLNIQNPIMFWKMNLMASYRMKNGISILFIVEGSNGIIRGTILNQFSSFCPIFYSLKDVELSCGNSTINYLTICKTILGEMLIAVDEQGLVWVWNLEDNFSGLSSEKLSSLSSFVPFKLFSCKQSTYESLTDFSAWSVAGYANHSWIAVSCNAKIIFIFDLKSSTLETHNSIFICKGHSNNIPCVAFYDKILASVSIDGTLKIWNLYIDNLTDTTSKIPVEVNPILSIALKNPAYSSNTAFDTEEGHSIEWGWNCGILNKSEIQPFDSECEMKEKISIELDDQNNTFFSHSGDEGWDSPSSGSSNFFSFSFNQSINSLSHLNHDLIEVSSDRTNNSAEEEDEAIRPMISNSLYPSASLHDLSSSRIFSLDVLPEPDYDFILNDDEFEDSDFDYDLHESTHISNETSVTICEEVYGILSNLVVWATGRECFWMWRFDSCTVSDLISDEKNETKSTDGENNPKIVINLNQSIPFMIRKILSNQQRNFQGPLIWLQMRRLNMSLWIPELSYLCLAQQSGFVCISKILATKSQHRPVQLIPLAILPTAKKFSVPLSPIAGISYTPYLSISRQESNSVAVHLFILYQCGSMLVYNLELDQPAEMISSHFMKFI